MSESFHKEVFSPPDTFLLHWSSEGISNNWDKDMRLENHN